MLEQKKTVKVRSSNIELLRIVAMYLIVIYHITCHCIVVQLTDPASLGRTAVDTFNHPVFYTKLLSLNTIMSFGIIGNAIFILISGYFMANRDGSQINLGNIAKKLLLELGFSSCLLVCVPTILHRLYPGTYFNLQDITIFNDGSWFVGYYFAVVLCGALFLNRYLAKLDQKTFAAFVLVLFALASFEYPGSLADVLASGLRTFLTGLFLYSMGGYIKRFDPFKRVRLFTLLLVILGCYLIIWISGYNSDVTMIENYFRSGAQGTFFQNIPIFANHNIVILISSICIFEAFRRIHLPSSRLITFLGKSTFMVYLMHDNSFFYELWNLKDWITILASNPLSFLLQLLKCGAKTFAIGVLAYILYELLAVIWKKISFLFIKRV